MNLKLKFLSAVIIPIILLSNTPNLNSSYKLEDLPTITSEELGNTAYSILDVTEDYLVIEIKGKQYVVPKK